MKSILVLAFAGMVKSFLNHAVPIGFPRVVPKEKVPPLYLEDWVAEMIDTELHRQSNEKTFEKEWMEKNRAAVFHRMESDFVNTQDPEAKEFQVHKKDTKLAWKDPQRYCADRCVATGNCDIYEDFFELGPKEVIAFCTDCVLSEDEEPCTVPEGFYDKPMP